MERHEGAVDNDKKSWMVASSKPRSSLLRLSPTWAEERQVPECFGISQITVMAPEALHPLGEWLLV